MSEPMVVLSATVLHDGHSYERHTLTPIRLGDVAATQQTLAEFVSTKATELSK